MRARQRTRQGLRHEIVMVYGGGVCARAVHAAVQVQHPNGHLHRSRFNVVSYYSSISMFDSKLGAGCLCCGPGTAPGWVLHTHVVFSPGDSWRGTVFDCEWITMLGAAGPQEHPQHVGEGDNVDVVRLLAHGFHTPTPELLHAQPLVAHALRVRRVSISGNEGVGPGVGESWGTSCGRRNCSTLSSSSLMLCARRGMNKGPQKCAGGSFNLPSSATLSDPSLC